MNKRIYRWLAILALAAITLALIAGPEIVRLARELTHDIDRSSDAAGDVPGVGTPIEFGKVDTPRPSIRTDVISGRPTRASPNGDHTRPDTAPRRTATANTEPRNELEPSTASDRRPRPASPDAASGPDTVQARRVPPALIEEIRTSLLQGRILFDAGRFHEAGEAFTRALGTVGEASVAYGDQSVLIELREEAVGAIEAARTACRREHDAVCF